MKRCEMIEQAVIKWRRHLHEYPELSFNEIKTSEFIRDILNKLPGMEVSTPTKTSVVAFLRGGRPGKTIGLRADTDALPVEEETGADYQSKNPGIMHACGHDTHTAVLLGVAKVLSGQKDDLEGNVKFIFQHAEEVPPGGAEEIVRAGVLDDVDMIFGLHIITYKPAGMVGFKKGPVSAASDVFTLNIQGKGSHGSTPELSIDPILTGVEIINNLNNIISRNISPFANAVISIGEFSSGKIANIIPDKAVIRGTVRSNDPEVRIYLKKRIEEIIKSVTEMYHASYTLDYIMGYGAVINDDGAVDIAMKAAEKVVGSKNIFEAPNAMGGEDFSAYTDKVKGAFFLLGGGFKDDKLNYMNHHPKFNVDESSLMTGVNVFVQIVNDTIGKK